MFGAPLFLFGTLAAGIPVLIHLLARRKSLPVQWPTLMFLEESQRKTARRRRIEQVLLMLLRAGILLVLAVGLAQPVIRYAGGMAAGSTMVVVVDNSMSMDARVEARSSLGDGLAFAQQALAELPGNAYVGVVPVVKDPSLGITGLSRGVEAARACLRAVRALPARGSIGGAVEEALSLVKSQGASHQEIYVVSDLQMNAFPLAGEISGKARNAVLTVVASGRPAPMNLTVEKISAFMPMLAPGGELSVTGVIANTSAQPAESVAALLINGVRRSTQQLIVPAGGRSEVSFSTRVESAGLCRIEVSVGEDALAFDNSRHEALFVPDVVKALVAAPRAELPENDAGFFISCALAPFSPDGAIRVDRCMSEEITSIDLMRYAAVFVAADGGGIGRSVEEKLEEFMLRRGTVVRFAGEPAAGAASLKRLDPPETLAFRDVLLADALFRRLPGIGLEAFRAVRVSAAEDVAFHPDDEVLLRTAESGRPMLLRRRRSSGAKYIFSISATPSSGNFVLRGLFPLVLQQMVYSSECAGGISAYRGTAGESIRAAISGADMYDVVAPSGRVERVKGGAGGVDTGVLLETGVYQIVPAGERQPAAYIVVNPPASEGDLKTLPLSVAAERMK
ncbi:MAG TPA: VWA domain-containing protein, partial [Planctomycetes bacterium]|nr:VWA domain-containing protein [Planctomycetota bacterium]